MTEPIPRTLGPYALEGLIDESPHALVHRARDPEGRLVALKVLKREAPFEAVLALYYQARQAMLLKHDGLAASIEVQETDDVHYLAMDLVDGPSLWRRVAAVGAFDPTAAVQIVAALAETLDCLHAAGIVHCAVTPEHVLLDRGDLPVLTGLGYSQDALGDVDFPRELVRHLWAIAPEVKASPRAATPAADVFSLGALLLMLLSGQAPSATADRDAVERGLEVARLVDLPDEGYALRALLRASLRSNPAKRPQSAWHFARMACEATGLDAAHLWSAPPLADAQFAETEGLARWYVLKRVDQKDCRVLRGNWRDIVCLLLRGRLKGRELAAPTVNGVFRPLAEIAEFAPVMRCAATA